MDRNRTVAGLDVHKDSIYLCIMGHNEAIFVNPYFIRQLPGHKSGVKDAQWIAECLLKNLIK